MSASHINEQLGHAKHEGRHSTGSLKFEPGSLAQKDDLPEFTGRHIEDGTFGTIASQSAQRLQQDASPLDGNEQPSTPGASSDQAQSPESL